MDAKKVLPVLRQFEFQCGCFPVNETFPCSTPHKDGCSLAALITEAEQEAREGGWKPGSEPPEDDRLVEITTLAYYSNGQWYSENDCRVPMMYEWRRRRTPPPFPGNPDLPPLLEQSEVKS